MQVPKVEKVVINMGLGRAPSNPKILESAVAELETITGQKAVKTKARKSISNFKLREGMPIGASVTLRGDRMWEFLDRLMFIKRCRDLQDSGKLRAVTLAEIADVMQALPADEFRAVEVTVDRKGVEAKTIRGYYP